MNKYLLMLSAAALIAAAPVYYAVNAQAEEAATAAQAEEAAIEITVDCTQATLDGEEVPAECKVTDDKTAAETEPAAAAADTTAE